MAAATSNFSDSTQVGQGGYGKVYRGVLADGIVVAIKRAQQGSLQGSKEFCTEIELLSRLHHRNLVSLLGYCDEEDEQVCLSCIWSCLILKSSWFIFDLIWITLCLLFIWMFHHRQLVNNWSYYRRWGCKMGLICIVILYKIFCQNGFLCELLSFYKWLLDIHKWQF